MPVPRLSRSFVPLAAAALLAAVAVPGSATTAVAAPNVPAAASVELVSVTLAVPSALDSKPFNTKRTVQIPKGWSATVVARPQKARLEVVTPDGRLLVSRPEYGLITRLTPNKRGRPTSSTLVKHLRQPHGMAFDGSTLYVAESDRIDRYSYSKGKVGKRHTVVSGLPDGKSKDLHGAYAHALKSVAVGPDHALYFSIGSTANTSADDRSKKPQRAAILRVAKGSTKAGVFARGVRNGTGLAVAPDGALWTAVNNRDRVAYPYHQDYDGKGSADDYGDVMQGYVNDHPLEPLAKLTKGRDLGWPYCNPDPDVDPKNPQTGFAYADRTFVRDVQLNADGTKLDCRNLAPVEQGLPAHSAPLGLSFATDLPGLGTGALVGVHGSWNRNPPRAPEVAFFGYADGGLGGQQTIMTGFQNSKGDRWGRPVAAVKGADGAIYVSDDLANAVYRLAPPA